MGLLNCIENNQPAIVYKQLIMYFNLKTVDNKDILTEYQKMGLHVYLLNKDITLFIIYKNVTSYYRLYIFEENNDFYWNLTPYNGSSYITKVDLENGNMDLPLFAIYENETLYKTGREKNDN